MNKIKISLLVLLLFCSTVFSASKVRLPRPRRDVNIWGALINQFLRVSHNEDGTLKATALEGLLAKEVDPCFAASPLSLLTWAEIAQLANINDVNISNVQWNFLGTFDAESGFQAQGDVLDNLNTLGAPTLDSQFIVATGPGAFAYESGATAKSSLGLGATDTVQFGATTLSALTIGIPASGYGLHIYSGGDIHHTYEEDDFKITTTGDNIDFDNKNLINCTQTEWDAAYTHVSNDGTDHGYIDQDLQTTASPSFVGVTAENFNFDVDYEAGENIAQYDAVYLKSDDKVYLARANANATTRAIGIAVTAITNGNTGAIRVSGHITNVGWSWTTGALVYVSYYTGGALVETYVGRPHVVGMATSATEIYIAPFLPTYGDFQVNSLVTSNVKVQSDILRVRDAATLIFGSSTRGRMKWATEGTDHLFTGLYGTDSYQWIIGDQAHIAKNFDHAAQSNPTIFLHSATDPDSDNTQWISFAHDQTDGVIDAGKGFLKLNDQVLFTDKAVFTQIDGDEYIDSLADGYVDYGATIGHRFNANTAITGTLSATGYYKAITTKTDTNYTTLVTDDTILVDTGVSDRTISLPAAASVIGKVYTIKKISSGMGDVIIDPYGEETIEGEETFRLWGQYEAAMIQSDGSNWHCLSVVYTSE